MAIRMVWGWGGGFGVDDKLIGSNCDNSYINGFGDLVSLKLCIIQKEWKKMHTNVM